jgi:hypothetical protein
MSSAVDDFGMPDGGGDALDLLDRSSRNLRDLFVIWFDLAPMDGDPDHAATRARTRGTAAKEILEQSALRLAAMAEVARVLRLCDEGGLVVELEQNSLDALRVTVRLDEESRGITAIDLRYSDEFADLIDELWSLVSEDLDHQGEMVERIEIALGRRRAELRTASFIRSHAPIHPSEHHHWYQDVTFASRVQALYDRLRNYPGAESSPTSDVAAIRRYEPQP